MKSVYCPKCGAVMYKWFGMGGTYVWKCSVCKSEIAR